MYHGIVPSKHRGKRALVLHVTRNRDDGTLSFEFLGTACNRRYMVTTTREF